MQPIFDFSDRKAYWWVYKYNLQARHKENKENSQNEYNKLSDIAATADDKYPTRNIDENQPDAFEIGSVSEEMSRILGKDQDASKLLEIKFHSELKDRWMQKWMQDELPKENKKNRYRRYIHGREISSPKAPKENLKVAPVLTEIATKRDQHFIETQNCIGSAISALGAAVSMILDVPKEGINHEKFTKYLCNAGQLLTDVFY